ncbi:MAG: two component sensor histidine kinase [Hyphomonadaceae bacterium]|nr:MAG: two component sensor histidine kinase [Hyphomonadaceae bacterium]
MTFIRAFFALISFCFAAIFCGDLAYAQEAVTAPHSERVIESDQIEIASTNIDAIPTNGWKQIHLRELSANNGVSPTTQGPVFVWVKFKFERTLLSPDELAFMMDVPRLGIKVYLNGNDIYEYYSISNYQTNSWNSPIYFQLPSKFLNAQNNEIVMRMDANSTYGINGGLLRVGPSPIIAAHYDFMNLADNLLPRSITNITLFLSFCLLLLWLARRKDYEFLWLAMTGIFWSARNWRYFIQTPPFDAKVFLTISNLLIYLFLIALLGFAGYFVKLSKFKQYIKIVAGASIASFLLHFIFQFTYGDVRSLYLLALFISLFSTLYIIQESAKDPTLERALIIMPLLLLLGLSFHDIGVAVLGWKGLPFSLQPYGSILLFLTFTFTLGGRIIHAFDNLENMNAILDTEVKAATDKLKVSEKAQHKLELSLAIENERERLMREIHDGIGSNLVTTLAIAQKQEANSVAVPLLKRAIADLRLAVDSLEPIQGEVVSLLGNLRHRIEPDMNEAGLKFVWRVENTPRLEWLEAVNSLHVLRILQEAFANIIAHANATQIFVNCATEVRNGRQGVLIQIRDDGKGMSDKRKTQGRGIANMKARAEAISAIFEFTSKSKSGTTVSLWLPVSILSH